MSSDRLSRRVVLSGLLGLTGCGFAPVYGRENAFQGQIAYEATESIAGFRLRQRLENRLGRGTAPAFLLKVDIASRERAAAITAEGDTARLNIIGTARWTLTSAADAKEVATGEVEAFTSYAATGSTIATQSTRDDALARLAIILADMIVSRILVLHAEPPA